MVRLRDGEIFEDVFICVDRYMNVTDRQTDKRTDGKTPHDGIGRTYA